MTLILPNKIGLGYFSIKVTMLKLFLTDFPNSKTTLTFLVKLSATVVSNVNTQEATAMYKGI